MHINMVRFILVASYMLIYSTSFAAPQLILTTDKTQVELGHPIRVQLYGISLKSPLSAINLEKLTPHFGLIMDYESGETTDQRWPGQPVQILQFKIYPRKAGYLSIPSLNIGRIHSKMKLVNIIAGETGRPVLKLNTRTPYQRQEMIIHFTLTTGYSNARLATKHVSNPDGFEVVPLNFSRTAIGGGKYQLQIGWALTALTAGLQKVNLPEVEYSVNGGSRKLFYPEIVRIKVKSLPSYLPPTIPVGNISVISDVSPSGLLQANTLSYWTLQLTSDVTDIYSLPPVLRQLKNNSKLQFLPAASGRKIQVTQNAVVSKVTHVIPFKVLNSGMLSLPTINFQYFEPEQGKIKYVNYTPRSIFVLSLTLKIVLTLTFFVLSIIFSRYAYKKFQRWKKTAQKKQQALQLLLKAGNKNDIRQAIRLFHEFDTGCKNTTLSQWKQSWQSRYHSNECFEDVYKKISNACYSKHDNIEFSNLASELLRLFNNRKRIKKFGF